MRRRLILGLALALSSLGAMAAPAGAAQVMGHYVPDSIVDEYRWSGTTAWSGRWVDKSCDIASPAFSVVLYESTNEGGADVRVCSNETTLCDVPLHPPGEWNTDPCSAGPLHDLANDTITDVHVATVSGDGRVCLYEHADWGGNYAYLFGGSQFHNMGNTPVGNDRLSSIRRRDNGQAC